MGTMPDQPVSQMTAEQQKALQEKLKNMSPEELRDFQKQQCIFCQIISGKIPAKKVYEDENTIVILDINPAAKGHLLVIPKEHYAIMPQISDENIGHSFLVAKYMSQIVLKVLRVGGTNIFVANGPAAGQRAQHFMIHVIPRKEGDGLLSSEEKLVDSGLLDKVRSSIEGRLNELLGLKKEVVRQKTLTEDEEAEQDDEEESDSEVASDEPKDDSEINFGENFPESKDDKIIGMKKKKIVKKKSKKSKNSNKEPEPGEEKDVVSLDDIANLFK
jgi:histidine triad (HIT) family protein